MYVANRRALTCGLLRACEITSKVRFRLVIDDAWELPAFRNMLTRAYQLDVDALGDQLVAHVGRIVSADPTIGGVVLHCSDRPPFAADLQRETGRALYDGSMIAEWLHTAVARTRYTV